MKEYVGINYEKKVDCFAKTEKKVTEFLYGDLEFIQRPWFTVLIPTYKRTDMLEEALNSAINQWHVSFPWDILVLDNEPYDSVSNDTEKLVRKLNNPRVLYYRNREHLSPGDNFNRGIYLARGKWVMMLHDDDLLIENSLQNMGRVVRFLSKYSWRELGAVNVKYYQFTFDANHPKKHEKELAAVQNYFLSIPTNFWLYKLTRNNILFTSHIGGDVPSNGATYNRSAVLDIGGFNDDLGISADLILNYNLENKYDVYTTTVPYGFYRWGANTMSQFESTYKAIKSGYDFREYVYSKNLFLRLWGLIFRRSQYQNFTSCVIRQRKKSVDEEIVLSDFDEIYNKRPNAHWYAFYSVIIKNVYAVIKQHQMKKLYKKSLKDKEIWE